MYMFDLNLHYDQSYHRHIVALIHVKHVHSSFSYGQFLKNTISVVLRQPVGMGLYGNSIGPKCTHSS